MLCILSFFVFAILGIFSASHRELAKKAWYCLVRKIQFKPCDINFNEELKGKMLGKLIFTHPRLGSFLYKWADVLSIIFVVLSIWSLWAVVRSSVYLIAYDTCDPYSEQGCSLAGDSCAINVASISFIDAVKTGTTIDWVTLRVTTFGEAITRIPNRLKSWDPASFIDASASYYLPYDATKPTALEIIDPSCKFCAELFANIKTAKTYDRHNLTYIAYPIPNSDGYRFPHSYLITSYLEAVKHHPLTVATTPADWQILERIFTGRDEANTLYQEKFNVVYDTTQAEATLRQFLADMGYAPETMELITMTAHSDAVAQAIAAHVAIVENEIQTIKIPTIMINGRRYDRLIGPEKLD